MKMLLLSLAVLFIQPFSGAAAEKGFHLARHSWLITSVRYTLVPNHPFFTKSLKIRESPGFDLLKPLCLARSIPRLNKNNVNYSNSTLLIQRKDIPLQGYVRSSFGRPLSGVSVKVKGTNMGVVTDIDGNFLINAPDNKSVLIFSCVGFIAQEIAIGDKRIFEITMTEELKSLDDIVIVGYSEQNKHKLTSAVSTVGGEEINIRNATSPSALLQGLLPGLQVTQGTGEPGAEGTQLLIRGVGTFSGAGTNPLIIVDGIPGSIEALNPYDIESVTVLKDAASAAIYGSRGANGVLVISTRKGKGSDFSIQYNFNLGISDATKLPKRITNSAEYMSLFNQARINSNLPPIYTQDQIDQYKNATDHIKYPNYDWLTDVFHTAYTESHYFNMSGDKNGTNYSLGFGAINQPGILKGNNYKKYTLSLALSSKVSKRITFGTNIQLLYGDKANPPAGSAFEFVAALSQTPLYRPQLADGSLSARAYPNELSNVALLPESISARTQNYYMQGNLSLDIEIVDGLKWQNRAGINYDNNKFKSFIPSGIPTYYYNDGSFAGNLAAGKPGLTVATADTIYYTVYSQLSYKKTFGLHNISAFAGVQEEDNQGSNLGAVRLQFPTNYLQEIDAGPTTGETNNGTSYEWAIRSLYGNLNYDYNDKYLFGSNIRRDGTSRLPANSRWGTFFSFSGGWRISKESFLKNVSWINDLKIRASWGELGNQNIGNYPYQAVLNNGLPNANYPFAGTVSTGYVANQLVDASLKWETTRITDIGLDLTIWNNRLDFTGDYFDKYTFDILNQSQIPLYVGLNAPIVNHGAVRNRGLEFAVKYRDRIGSDFDYTIGGNIQGYKNTLVSFSATQISRTSIRQQGHELDGYYLYLWDGIFQSQSEIDNSPIQPITPSPGDLKIRDVNGDGKIDPNDRTFVPGRYPKFTYSGSASASYKQFQISIQVYGSYGQKIYVDSWGIDPFVQGAPPTTNWENAWTPTNHTNTMPKIYAGDFTGTGYAPVQYYASTYYLKDASFVRLKNLMIGYNLSKKWLTKIGLRSCRVYITGENLLTISKYPGLDPERVGDGFYSVYPQNKTYSFGVSVQL